MFRLKDVVKLLVVGWAFNFCFLFKVEIEALFSTLQDWFSIDMKIEALFNINTRFSRLTSYYVNKLCMNKLFERVYIYAWNTNPIRGNPIKVFIPFLYPVPFFSIVVSVYFIEYLKHKLWSSIRWSRQIWVDTKFENGNF